MKSDPDHTSDAAFADELLSQLEPLQPSALLQRRVAEIPLRHAQVEARWWWPFATAWQPALGLAAAVALGLFVGAQNFWSEDAAPASAAAQPPQAAGAPEGAAGPSNQGAETGREMATQGPGALPNSAFDDPAYQAFEQSISLAFGEQWEDPEWLSEETL